MKAERLAEIRENQRRYAKAYVGCVVPKWLQDYAADVGDLLAMLDALCVPLPATFPYVAGNQASLAEARTRLLAADPEEDEDEDIHTPDLGTVDCICTPAGLLNHGCCCGAMGKYDPRGVTP